MIGNSDHEAIIRASRGFWSDCPFAFFSAARLIRSCNSLSLNHWVPEAGKLPETEGNDGILLRATAHSVRMANRALLDTNSYRGKRNIRTIPSSARADVVRTIASDKQ